MTNGCQPEMLSLIGMAACLGAGTCKAVVGHPCSIKKRVATH